MTMRTYHGALLVVLAMVMAMLSTGMCTAPVPAPAPARSLEESPTTKLTCLKILTKSGCDRKACHDNCFIKLKGNGSCLRDECWCSYTYTCKSSLVPPSPA